MKKVICLFIAGSMMTSCVVVRGKDGAPGNPGTSGTSSSSGK